MAYKLSITPEIERLTEVCLDNSKINAGLYKELDIKEDDFADQLSVGRYDSS